MKRRLLLASAVIVLAVLAYNSARFRAVESENARLRTALVRADSLVTYSQGIYSKQALGLKTAKALLQEAESLNSDLAEEIRRVRAEPRSVTTITIEAPPETLRVSNVDTVYSSLGTRSHSFGVRSYSFDIQMGRAEVEVDSTGATLRFWPSPLRVSVVLTRLPLGDWNTYVVTDPPYPVGDIITRVVEQRSWYEKWRGPAWAVGGASVVGWALTGRVGYLLPVGALIVLEAIHR